MFPSLCLSSPYKFVLEIEILFFVCAGRIQSAYAGGESSFAWKCCKGASISYHSIEPANVDELEGWLCTSSGDVCFLSTTGTDDVGMESAIETCYGYEAHVCLWEDMMMLCGSGHNPYESMSSGWYGDHGISSGGDYDDEYGTWSADHCASNNDGTARAASESFGFRCCRGARLELPQLDCPANSAGVDILDGCLCGPGYSGSIALSQTEPYYSGDCVAVTCPANSEGADLPSGCNCSAGFGGTIAASQTVPYYTGVCGELVPPSMSDCSALNFMGTTDENERYATRPELVAPTAFDSADPDSAGGVELAVVALTGDLIVTNTTQFPYDAVTVVRFVATDSSGLTASCEITVTILDDQPPVLEDCSGLNINGTTDEGVGYGTIQTGRVSLVYPTAQDNSGEVLTAVATVGGSAVIAGTVIIDGTVRQATRFPFGVVTWVRYTVTDSAGLSDSCDVSAVIADVEPPTLQDCGNLHVSGSTDPGENYGTIGVGSVALTVPMATDNSGLPVTVLASLYGEAVTADTPFPYDWVTTLTYTATDAAGISASCDVEVTIVDDQPPVLAGCVDIYGNTSIGQSFGTTGSGSVVLVFPTAEDNLSGELLPVTAAVGGIELADETPFPFDSITVVTFSTTDSSGHSSSCDVSVTVVDVEPPVLSGCADIVGHCDPGERYGTAAMGSLELSKPPATDNSNETVRVTGVMGGGVRVYSTTKFLYDKVRTLRFVATDSSGLTASCEITVTILDDQPPVLEDCSGLNINGTTDEGVGYGTIQTGRVSLVYPTAQDNSGEVLTAVATVNGSTVALDTAFPAGSVTVVYVATDSAGLYDSCSVTVTITISPSPRYTMALAVDYATLEEDGEAYTAFSLSFREALAITISINPARIILTSIAPYADRRQLQSSGTEDEAAGDSTGVLLEFYVDPPEGDASDDSLTPAAAIEQLIEAAATGELEEVLATEAQIVLVPGSLGLTVETAVGVDEGRGTLTVGFLPLSTSSTECSVESGTDEKELADHVFNYPRGMTASDGWLYITDNNLISRMQSESSDYPESGPQKMVGDGSESRHSGNRDGVRFAPPHHRSSVCERRLTRSVGVCCRHTPQVGFTTPARLRWQSTR